MAKRISELMDWAAETGRELPMSPSVIAALEAQGHLVELTTGRIALFGALRPSGEAAWLPGPVAMGVINLVGALELEASQVTRSLLGAAIGQALVAMRDKHYIADGRWHSFGPVDQGIWRRPTLTKRSGSGYLMADWELANLDNWRRLLARHPVAAVIYIGDDQGIDTFEALAPGRVGLVLNYQASWTRERLTVSHQAYGVRTAAPCVVGVGDAISALEAIRLLIPRIVCQ